MPLKGPLHWKTFILEYGIIKCSDLESAVIFLISCTIVNILNHASSKKDEKERKYQSILSDATEYFTINPDNL